MNHEYYISRCVELALNGLGTTYPNPLVGCVIVNADGLILGEGFHHRAGQPHAEVNAITQAEERGYTQSDFSKSTLYVNLEPCSHYGKTPPCALLIIEKGFKNVVVGTLDPHEKVAGKGVQMLQDAGIKVVTGVLVNECNTLNKRFFTWHTKKRPYVILKWAESADSFLAPLHRDKEAPVWITNEYSRQLVHQMRAQEEAILVGAQTVLDDDPSLTVRDWAGEQPIRIVLDGRDKLPEKRKVFNDQSVTQILKRSGGDVSAILEDLYFLNIQSVIIEGGARTLQHFIEQDQWDEIHQFMGTQVYFNEGIAAPQIPNTAQLVSRKLIGQDVLKVFSRL